MISFKGRLQMYNAISLIWGSVLIKEDEAQCPMRKDTFHIIIAAIGNEEVPADSLRKGKGCF